MGVDAPISLARRWTHWLGAALVVGAVAFGLWIAWQRPAPGPESDAVVWRFSLHKTLGLAAGLYLLARLAVMARGGFVPAGGRRIELFAAGAAQGFMLAALAILPLTGLLQHMLVQGAAPVWLFPVESLRGLLVAHDLLPRADPQMAERLGRAHMVLAWGLIAALALHAGAAVKHHVVDRDGVLARMMGREEPGRHVASAGGHARLARRGGLGAGVALAFAIAGSALVLAERHQALPPLAAGDPREAPAQGGMRWIVDPKQSRLEIEAVQGGTPFSAVFRSFDVDIDFDPARPEAARIEARIAASSFVSGLPDRDAVVHGEEWLDAVRHPLAQWSAQRVETIGENRFRAEGELAIGPARAAVDLVFSLLVSGDVAIADGEARFARAAVGLGRGETGTPEAAGPDIKVKVRIRATRAAPEAAL